MENSDVTQIQVGPVAADTEAPETAPGIEETAAPEKDNSDIFTSRFAALSKKEKAIREEAEKIKAEQARFAELDSIKEGGVAKALEYHGFTIDDVIDYALGQQSEEKEAKDPVASLAEEFEAYKRSVEEEKERKRQEEENLNQQSYDEAIESHKQKISDHLSQNTDTYELITSQNQQELVWEVIEAHFTETGEVLPIEDASVKVETYLENQVRELLKLNKFKAQAESSPANQSQSGVGDKLSKTLTQDQGSGVQVNQKFLSKDESLRQAAKALKWT